MPLRPTTRELAHDGSQRGARSLSRALDGLIGVILLAGSVRPSQLQKAVGRFVPDLPVEAGRTVLDCWHQQLADVASYFDIKPVSPRVIVDRSITREGFEQDPFDYRGTGGLLRDLAPQDPIHDNEYLLVANGAQILFEPLPVLIEDLAATGGDISMACTDDGAPIGLMLVRCGCLKSIPRRGFIDLNEQALPALAEKYDVMVVRFSPQVNAPIRTFSGYLDVMRKYHRHLKQQVDANDPFAEDWHETFRLIEPGADVHDSAVVHDSVVLSGARVEADAVLVRTLVCPDAVVTRRRSAVDCLVSTTNSRMKDLDR